MKEGRNHGGRTKNRMGCRETNHHPCVTLVLGDTWEKDLERVLNAETLGVILNHQVEDELYWMGTVHADSHIISDVAVNVNNLMLTTE